MSWKLRVKKTKGGDTISASLFVIGDLFESQHGRIKCALTGEARGDGVQKWGGGKTERVRSAPTISLKSTTLPNVFTNIP